MSFVTRLPTVPTVLRRYSVGDATVHEVCPKTVFTLGIRASGAATSIVLAERLPVADWVAGMLVVRIHEVLSWTNTTVSVVVMGSSFVDDDPSIAFSTGVPNATALLGTPDQPVTPAQRVVALAAPIGPMVDVRLVGDAGTAGTITVALSVDLVGRRR